jgi:hypothetical protein
MATDVPIFYDCKSLKLNVSVKNRLAAVKTVESQIQQQTALTDLEPLLGPTPLRRVATNALESQNTRANKDKGRPQKTSSRRIETVKRLIYKSQGSAAAIWLRTVAYRIQ